MKLKKHFFYGKRLLLAALTVVLLCFSACSEEFYKPLMTDWQLRSYLKEIYLEDFDIVSSQGMDRKTVVRGKQWTVCPSANPDLVFSVSESIEGSSGPIPFQYYHSFSEGYGRLLYQKKLEGFLGEYRDSHGNSISFGEEGFFFSEDTLEEQLTALIQYTNALNREFPFYQQEVYVPYQTVYYRIGEIEVEQWWSLKEYGEEESLQNTEALALIDTLKKEMKQQQALWTFAQDFMAFAEKENIFLWKSEEIDPNQRSYQFSLILFPEESWELVEKICRFVNSYAEDETFRDLLSDDSTFYSRMKFQFYLFEEEEYDVGSVSQNCYWYYPLQSSCSEIPYLSADPRQLLKKIQEQFDETVLDSGPGDASAADPEPNFPAAEEDPEEEPPVIRYNPETGTRIISGDKITIDGNQIIVEIDGKTIIIDDEVKDLSAVVTRNFPGFFNLLK